MTGAETPRARARAAQIEAIKDAARRSIAENGVAGLSLRGVARELGLVSSALYRYFSTRDELLTALIFDAYNELGAAVEQADARCHRTDVISRWNASTHAIRRWARSNPNEYALIFGTPVSGYVAPELTIEAASRVPRVLGSILSENARRRTSRPAITPVTADVDLIFEVEALATELPDLPPRMYTRALMAWTHIFGFLSFELFGHYKGSVRSTSAMFDVVVAELAELLGLSD